MSRWGVRITRIQVIYVFSIKSNHAIGSIGDPPISDNPHLRLGALLEVEISKKCTRMWREARFEVNMLKAHHFRTTFGRWTVVLCGKGQGFCTLRKVKKTWGFCRICKNVGTRGTFEEDLQWCIFAWQAQYKRHLHQTMLGRQSCDFLRGYCFLEHQIFSFAKKILRDRCGTLYDLASFFRVRRSTSDRWGEKMAKHRYRAVSWAALNCQLFN